MTDHHRLSRQALYNRRKRLEAGGAVHILPRDKAALDVAVELSGKSQAEWLRDAIDEKIDREIPDYRRWQAEFATRRRSRMFEFFSAFGLIKTKKLARDLAGLLALTDKDAAGRADLAVKEKNLDAAGQLLSQLRDSHAHESREFEKLDQVYHQYMSAAERLKQRLEDPASEADRTQIEAGLAELVAKLEAMAPELAQHRQDVEESAALLNDATAAYEEKANDLKQSKARLSEASRELTRAQITNERAKEHAEQAARVAGLRDGDDSGSGLNVALSAMQEQTAKLRSNAEANRMKAAILAKGPPTSSQNDFVKEALAQAQGAPSPTSLLDRLAALKK